MMMVKSMSELVMMSMTVKFMNNSVEQNDDDYSVKKRLAQVADEGDKKSAKKARKMAESMEGIQKNTILSFIRPGGNAANQRPAAKVASSKFEKKI